MPTKHFTESKLIYAAAENFRPKGAFIAGGALLSAFTKQPINDVDMYFKTKADFVSAIEEAYNAGLWCVAATDRAVTFVYAKSVIQLMHFDFFPTAEAIFDAFDFTVCMAAIDMDADEWIFHDDFLKHASQRYLKFHAGTRYPFGSLMRVLKYQGRGYTMSQSDLLRIALCCHRVPLTSWDDLAAAIGGQYGEKVRLDDDRPFSIEAAIEVIGATDTVFVPASPEEMPGSAEEMLIRLFPQEFSAECRAAAADRKADDDIPY